MKRGAVMAARFLIILGSLVAGLESTAAPQESAKPEPSGESVLAATPPMGWNSWDGYGTTVKEAEVKANASWLAEHLKSAGWQYVVVDMEWFVTNSTCWTAMAGIHQP